METKVNVAELLKDCPKGMELDCVNYDGIVTFEEVTDSTIYPIKVSIKYNNECFIHLFTKYGQTTKTPYNKCVIFPKGKTTWEGFQRPFENGDIVAVTMIPEGIWTGIFKQYNYNKTAFESHCSFSTRGEFCGERFKNHRLIGLRLASKDEKVKLFKAIKENGYKWNAETKTLEKLIVPKFKVGDKVESIFNKNRYIITELTDKHYVLVEVTNKFRYVEPITEDKNWELVPNKFDNTTLKPFESRVLVRDYDNQIWIPTFWGKYLGDDSNCRYLTTNGCYRYCIPYEGNEHLLGTTNDCGEYFKTWK